MSFRCAGDRDPDPTPCPAAKKPFWPPQTQPPRAAKLRSPGKLGGRQRAIRPIFPWNDLDMSTPLARRWLSVELIKPRTHVKICDIKNFWTKFCPNLTILVSLESWRRDLSKFGKTKLSRYHKICQNRKFGFRVKDPKFGFELGLRIWNFRFSRKYSNFDKKSKFRHGGLS